LTLVLDRTYNLPSRSEQGDHNMSGQVRTREVCSVCAGKFKELFVGKAPDLICPTCRTRPKTVYIYFYDKTMHKPCIISRYHKTGHMFTSYSLAYGVLESIRTDIDLCKAEGKRFDIRKYISAELEEYRGKFLFRIEDPGPDQITWLSDIRSRKRAKSYLTKIEQYCRDHFIPKFGDKNMLELETMDVAKFRKYIVETYKTTAGKPLSEKTVKNVMDQLRAFCNWLHKMKRDFQIPIFDVVSVPEKVVRTMPLEDREKAFAALTSPQLKAIIDCLIKHPIRPSEACALDVRHFDLKARTIWIESSLDCDRTVKTRKNKKEYIIPLHPGYDTSYFKGRFGRETAFPNKLGTRYTAWVLNEAWKRACKNAGVPYVNLYNATKHTTMTKYALDGHSERDMELMAGQSTRGMSRKYVNRSVEMLRKMHGSSVTEIKQDIK
jgi:integrase